MLQPLKLPHYAQNCSQPTPVPPLTSDLCGQFKAYVLALEDEQRDATAFAAIPTDDPLRSPTAIPPSPSYTPYVLTEADRRPVPRSRTGIDPGRPYSEWYLGRIVGTHGEPYGVSIRSDHTSGEHPFSYLIRRYNALTELPHDPAIVSEQSWRSPYQIGALLITNVTAQDGIVSFVGENGQTGTFNLANEQWTLGRWCRKRRL